MVARMNQPLLHVAREADLARARKSGRYRAPSLDTEGFLHCCEPHQLDGVLRRWFAGVHDASVLHIDPGRLDARVVRENTTGGAELFPHVYGEVPMGAILEVVPLRRDDRARAPGDPA